MRRGQEASSAVVNKQQPCGPEKKKRLTMVRKKKGSAIKKGQVEERRERGAEKE